MPCNRDRTDHQNARSGRRTLSEGTRAFRAQVEEYAILSKVALCFFERAREAQMFGHKGPKDANCKLTIAVRDILGAQVLTAEERPHLPGFAFFEVETLGRVYIFMTRWAPREKPAAVARATVCQGCILVGLAMELSPLVNFRSLLSFAVHGQWRSMYCRRGRTSQFP
jgi:hypothetical protein